VNPVELIIGLILAAAVLATLARKIGIPYPVLLVLGGLVLGFMPGLPPVRIPPDVVFLVFIPPLVYIAAAQVTLRDFRNDLRPILLLAIGLVLATLVVVIGVTTWFVDGFSWATAFVLAAIIGPTDTVAVNAVAAKMPIPRRTSTILEGESLVNDIVALVAYKMAVDAVTTGVISYGSAAQMLLWASTAGIGVGLGVGVVSAWVRRLIIDDPTVSIIISLLTGFAAYLGAEAIGASGILATVSAGLYVGRRLSKILSPVGRVQAFSFWQTITFMLEGLAFVLIGLELRTVMDDLADFALATLLWYGVLVSTAVIVLRLVWVFLFAHVPRYLSRRLRESEPCPPWQHIFLLGWAGMRGVDSLAAALAVPLALADGATPFPQRSLILFLSFSVILATLVLQGLTLPLLIRWFNVQQDHSEEKEEARARLAAIREALQRLEDPLVIAGAAAEILAQVRTTYVRRLQSAEAELNSAENDGAVIPLRSCQRLLRQLLDTERRVVLELRDRGVISNDVQRRIERSLDYEELRLAD
jgi:CPA1 family monovalent cation:H+ antiporter